MQSETIQRSNLICLHSKTPSPTDFLVSGSSSTGIIGRNLAEAQDDKKRDVTLSLFKFLKKPWQQQAGQEGKHKKQDVSMGALKQTQNYVPVLGINTVCIGREEVPARQAAGTAG